MLLLLITTFNWKNLLLLTLLTLIAIAYVVPLSKRSLREFAGLKSFLVALVWTGLIIVYPLLNGHVQMQLYPLHILGFFVYFFALTIPFDIRDLQFDLPSQKTLPQVFGVVGAKVIACGLILVFYFISANFNQEIWKNVLLGAFCMLTSFLIFYTKPQRSVNYFAAIDALMILLGLWFFV